MPGQRLPMRKIRDVLRLSASGMSKRQIAASLGLSPTAAGEWLRRARRAGLGWPLADDLTDEALEAQLYPPPQTVPEDRRPQPDWAAMRRNEWSQSPECALRGPPRKNGPAQVGGAVTIMTNMTIRDGATCDGPAPVKRCLPHGALRQYSSASMMVSTRVVLSGSAGSSDARRRSSLAK